MKMSQTDALKILNLPVSATHDDIKLAYRKACAKFHPDKNPAGLEMMKLVNIAYESLSDYVSKEDAGEYQPQFYSEEVNIALNAIIGLGLTIEICGAWVWVSGDTRPHKEILKASGFKWAPKKCMWHFRPSDYKSFSRGKWDMDKIRSVHGSHMVKNNTRQQLESN